MQAQPKRKWNYVLQEQFHLDIDLSVLFKKTDTTLIQSDWGEITPQGITIFAGYAWNGCSGNVWQGKTIIPEEWMPVILDNGKRYTNTLAGSLVHDYMYQFLFDIKKTSGRSLWIIRRVADKAFYQILTHANFRFAKIYYVGVRLLGPSTYIQQALQSFKS